MTAHAEAIRIMHANVGQDVALGLLSPRRFATALRACTAALHRCRANPPQAGPAARPREHRSSHRRRTSSTRDPADPDPAPPDPPRTRRSPGGGPGSVDAGDGPVRRSEERRREQ